MKITRISLLAAVIGVASLTASAGELTATTSIRGRSGVVTVVRAAPEKTTIALSKQDKGVGVENERTRPVKARTYEWHNASRPAGGS